MLPDHFLPIKAAGIGIQIIVHSQAKTTNRLKPKVSPTIQIRNPKKEITVTVTRTLPGNKGEAMDKGKLVISNSKLVDGVKKKDNVIVRVTSESNKEIIAEYVRKA